MNFKREVKASLAYIFFSCVYIFLGDYLVLSIATSLDSLSYYQSIKGGLFILISGGFVYVLIRHNTRSATSFHSTLKDIISHYQLIFDKSPLPCFIIDAETLRYIKVNQTAVEKYARPESEYLQANVVDFIVGFNASEVRALIKKIGRSGYEEMTIQSVDGLGKLNYQQVVAQRIALDGKEAIIFVSFDITSQKDNKIQVVDQMLEAVDQERAYISSEIHDGIKQYFGLANGLLKSYRESNQSQQELIIQRVLDLVEHGLEESRRLSHRLSPTSLNPTDLYGSIQRMVDNLNLIGDVTWSFEAEGEQPLADCITLNLYRIVQEATRNVRKHARASRASISMYLRDGWLSLKVEDNGVGFLKQDSGSYTDSLGLTTMRSRALKLNGNLSINSNPNEGTVVLVKVPLDHEVSPSNEERISAAKASF